MPLFEYRCRKCGTITEALVRGVESEDETIACASCGSGAATKMVSLVSFQVARRAKYSDEFLDKAKPFLKTQKETARFFAESRGSEDSKTFQLAEQIGRRIDRTLVNQLPKHKG